MQTDLEWPYGQWPEELAGTIAEIRSRWTEAERLQRGRLRLGNGPDELRRQFERKQPEQRRTNAKRKLKQAENRK